MPDRYVEVRRTVDLHLLLIDAAELLWQARGTSGAANTYKSVEDDLRAVVAEFDAHAEKEKIMKNDGRPWWGVLLFPYYLVAGIVKMWRGLGKWGQS